MSTFEPKKRRWVAIYSATVALKAHSLGRMPGDLEMLEFMKEAARVADQEESVRTMKNNEGWELP